MKRLKVRKHVIIYHPSTLYAEKGSILRCKHILFGESGNKDIMSESSHPKKFTEFFEIQSSCQTARDENGL